MAPFKTNITVQIGRTIYPVSNLLHSHFIEHVGRTIYDGIWIEERSGYSRVSGLRSEIIDDLRHLKPAVLKWPGGCFANTYHWEHGIGPKNKRTRQRNTWWGTEESNQFGTDEFMHLCEKTGAMPYICLNLGTGTVNDALNWLEYCNLKGNTEYSRLRSQHNIPDPFKVIYWSIGNEPWGYGGNLDPVQYANEFRRYATFLKQADPAVQLVACGHNQGNWNQILLENLKHHLHLVDHLSLHSIYKTAEFGGGSQPKTNREYYELFSYLPLLENDILKISKIMDQFPQGEKKIGIAVDAWGIQHPEAVRENGMEQPVTLRDGLMTGCVLHLFHIHANKISMTNLAYTVNALNSLIQTEKETVVQTPTYHVFDILRNHIGNDGLETKVETRNFRTRGPLGRHSLPFINASASINRKSYQIYITLINLHIEKEAEVSIQISGGVSVEGGNAKCLTADSPNEQNTFEKPFCVEPQNVHIDRIDNPVIQKLPPLSLTSLKLQIV